MIIHHILTNLCACSSHAFAISISWVSISLYINPSHVFTEVCNWICWDSAAPDSAVWVNHGLTLLQPTFSLWALAELWWMTSICTLFCMPLAGWNSGACRSELQLSTTYIMVSHKTLNPFKGYLREAEPFHFSSLPGRYRFNAALINVWTIPGTPLDHGYLMKLQSDTGL